MNIPRAARSRAGFTLAELLVGLLVSVLVLSMTATVFTTQFRIAQRTLRDLEGHQAAALAWSILSGEVRATGGVRDYEIGPGDSVRTRAFRGGAWPCPGDPVRPARVAYRGDRSPNATKDSVLVLTDTGDWIALDLTYVGPVEICPGTGGPVHRWTLSGGYAGPGGVTPLYLRVFESGAYSLERSALRYRVGRGGRQPVSAERFDTLASMFAVGRSPVVGVGTTLPLAGDEFIPATGGGRRVAWPRGIPR